MQDRPSAQELIATISSFLEQELLPTISDQRLRFRGLVAANVLGIVARELAAGDTPLWAERDRLLNLLDQFEHDPTDSDALRRSVTALSQELCIRIRAGEFDDGAAFEAALAHAEATSIEKLQIANPRYLARIQTS
ncbi:MAG: DUF6285 domain-containing protein [Roseiflexaceae bacterium]|nr:DUF6285 domain-containing protein [Roseiflexaceae bacterium]